MSINPFNQCEFFNFSGKNPELIIARLNQLPSLVSARQEEFQNQKKAQEEHETLMKEHHFKYVSTLLESLKIMENLVEKHIIEIQMEQYATNTESLKVQCDALLLKIKSLYLEILIETYTKVLSKYIDLTMLTLIIET